MSINAQKLVHTNFDATSIKAGYVLNFSKVNSTPETAEASRFGQPNDFIALTDKGSKKYYVTFLPGQIESQCNVTIMDDNLYEPEIEQFLVYAASSLDNDFIDKRRSFASVRILPDPKDG